MTKHRTEQVYDDEMSPLVAQLIAIAKREKIPLLVSAGMILRQDDHGNVHEQDHKGTCDTLLLHGSEDAQHPELLKVENRYGLAYEVIRGHEGFDTARSMAITSHYPPRKG